MHRAGKGREMKNDWKNSSDQGKNKSSVLLHLRFHQRVHLSGIGFSPRLLHYLAHYEV